MEKGTNVMNYEQTMNTSHIRDESRASDLYYKVYDKLHEEISNYRVAGEYNVCDGLIIALEILHESFYH